MDVSDSPEHAAFRQELRAWLEANLSDDLHLYMKRAKSCAIAFGDATWHRKRVARLIGA